MSVFVGKVVFDVDQERYFRIVGDVQLKDNRGRFIPHCLVVEQFDDGNGGITESAQQFLSLAKLPDELSHYIVNDAVVRVCTWPRSSSGFIEFDVLDHASDSAEDDFPVDLYDGVDHEEVG